jgi:hypothetical protein
MRGPCNALRVGLLLFAATVTLNADWKVYADKKPNQITGLRNVHADVGAKGLSTAVLQLGCVDGRPILRVANRFRAFRLEGSPGAYYSPVKVRASESTEYMDAHAPAIVYSDTMFLFLDDKAGELVPKMRNSESLFVQLFYQNEQKVTDFRMAGIDAALAKMAEVGCRP